MRREGSRERYRDGIPGFAPQTSGEVLDPVMVIKGAHGDGKRSGVSQFPILHSINY